MINVKLEELYCSRELSTFVFPQHGEAISAEMRRHGTCMCRQALERLPPGDQDVGEGEEMKKL